MILHSQSEEEFFQKIEQIITRVVASKSKPDNTPTNLISEKAAAPIIGMSKSNLARKRKAGLITFIKSGERYFYKQAHLDAYLKEVKLRGTRFQ